MRIARSLLTTTVLFAGICGAHSADYLRGSISEPTYQAASQGSDSIDWSGFHFGGTGTFSAVRMNHNGTGQRIANGVFPNLEVTDQIGPLISLGKGSVNKAGFSAFAGYSTQWDDVIMGVEGEYGYLKATSTAAMSPIGRTLSYSGNGTSGHLWDIIVNSGSRKVELQDYGVARIRIGAAYGRFLPFFTVGLAAGRVKTTTSVDGQYAEYELQPIRNANGDITGYNRVNHAVRAVNYRVASNKLTGGWAVGGGLDVAITSNVFLRGQWEYLNIGTNKSTNISLHTFKGGAAVKF